MTSSLSYHPDAFSPGVLSPVTHAAPRLALVTGAAGFVGSHVVRQLLAQGAAVRALVLPGEDVRNLRGLDVEVRLGDVTDAPSLARAMRGVDAVFHLAALYVLWAPDARRITDVNVAGTRNVLDAAAEAGVTRVVMTSSIARFGGQGSGRRATEESSFALGPTGSLYARSKAEAHEVALAAARTLDVVIVAPCGPIGAGDVGPTPTGRLLATCLALPAITVTRSVVNFIDVRDVAAGHLLAHARGVRGRSYLLGHRDLSLAELARLAAQVRGRRVRVLEVPSAAARAGGRALSFLADHVTRRAPPFTREAAAIAELGLAADPRRAVAELGLPQSPLEGALEEAFRFFTGEGRDRLPALVAARLSR